MPGLEPQDITVIISGNRVTIRGAYRGSRQHQPEILISEWTIGPYYREVVLPQPVDGALHGGSALAIQVQTYSQPAPGSITSGWMRPASKCSQSSVPPLLLALYCGQ
jgi:hypothetical protein